MSFDAADGPRHQAVVDLIPLLRRVVAARVKGPDMVEDLVQETLARVMESADRIDDGALVPYAIVTARNLVRSLARDEERAGRHLHRLRGVTPETPEEAALREEERRAVATALARLPEDDRRAVVGHELHGVDTATLAKRSGSTPGAVAARLARARARLRVDYLLAAERLTPPTERCRPVLIALSSGDRRRQRALDAGDHLLSCATCSALAEPLVERRRPPAALLAVPGLSPLLRAVRAHPVQTAGAVGTVAAVAVVLAFAMDGAVDCRDAPHRWIVEGRVSSPSSEGLGQDRRTRVKACGVEVESVPANEGFWARAPGGPRLWVQLGAVDESRFRVTPGATVTFEGTAVAHDSSFPAGVGVDRREGADALRRAGFHIEARARDVRVK